MYTKEEIEQIARYNRKAECWRELSQAAAKIVATVDEICRLEEEEIMGPDAAYEMRDYIEEHVAPMIEIFGSLADATQALLGMHTQ